MGDACVGLVGPRSGRWVMGEEYGLWLWKGSRKQQQERKIRMSYVGKGRPMQGLDETEVSKVDHGRRMWVVVVEGEL